MKFNISIISVLLFFTVIFFKIGIPVYTYADAYLSEDRVYYGADSYTVDYDKKVIHALGHAFFRKQQKTIHADKILIHYAKDEKKAFFFNNVVIKNRADGSQIHGNYGEARFKEDFYYIEGDAIYFDEKRTISSRRIEAIKDENYIFLDNVQYSDEKYIIKASSLNISDDTAVFRSKTHAVDIESGDSAFCDTITYFQGSEDVIFQDRVLYIEKDGKMENDSLVVESEVMRYYHDKEMFVLLGDVYMMNGDYTLRSSIVKYFREKSILEAVGDIVVYDGDKYIYCNNLEFNVDTKKIVFFNSTKGIFKPKVED